MKKIISISQIVDSREMAKGTREVIALADAFYDENRHVLEVQLGDRVLMTDAHGHESELPEEWLPSAETVKEAMDLEEAPDAAKEIFHRWAGKVRHAIPSGVPG